MKKVVSLILALCMLLTVAVSLVSCGAPKDDGAKIKVYLGGAVYDLDPTDYYVDSNAEQVISLLFEPLFRYVDGKLECAVADDYTINEDDRTINITLRETYWSNGTRVKAEDFRYAWTERLLGADNPNPAAALLYDIENAVELRNGTARPSDLMVEAVGVYELKITYREGGDPEQLLRNLASVATSPVRELADKSTIGYWAKSIATIVTNGPFRLAEYDAVSGAFTVERNKGYHQSPDVKDYDDEVRPGQLVAVTTPYGDEIAVSYKDIEDKTVFYLSEAPMSERDDYKKKAKVYDDTSVYTYVFNTENPLFANAKVRTALSMAIDRDAIISAITFGKAADGFVPDVSGGSEASLISTGANIDGAKDLLATVDLSGIEKKFTLTIADDAESIAIAELVKAAWQQLGFDVTIEKLGAVSNEIESTTIWDSEIQQLVKLASFGERKFDVIAIDWQTYTDDAFVALASLTSTMNGCGRVLPNGAIRTSITGWSDKDYDKLVAEAYAANGKDRAQKLALAEEYLCGQMPVIPLVFNQNASFVSKSLKKLDFDEFGNVIFTDAKQKNYKKYLAEDSEEE